MKVIHYKLWFFSNSIYIFIIYFVVIYSVLMDLWTKLGNINFKKEDNLKIINYRVNVL